jgi:subtilase family serine protease
VASPPPPKNPVKSPSSALGLRCAIAVVAGVLIGCGGTHARQRTASVRSVDAGTGCLTHVRPPLCYAPSQFRTAYGVQPLLSEGIDGHGRTVVLIERELPSATVGATVIEQDLEHYESRFGIPVSGLEVLSANPSSPSAALATAEELLDVEMVHTIAPGAAIRILPVRASEASPRAAARTIPRAVNEAVRQNLGDVISLSLGLGEHCLPAAQLASLHSALRAARDRHITVIAASGDLGAAAAPCSVVRPRPLKGVVLPAADPLVTSVGGTRLLADRTTGRYMAESAWNRPSPPGAVGEKAVSLSSGGGFSSVYGRPSYQAGAIGAADRRGVPDVAADADGRTGLALLAYVRGKNFILPAGGTSAAAPMWAGLIALADQYAGRRLGFVNPALYRLARGPHYHAAFHDVTQGDNSVAFSSLRIEGYRASPGWDPVTGWGSPNAQVLVPLLAKHVRPGDGRGL